MIEFRRGEGLADEPAFGVGVQDHLRPRYLEGDFALKFRIEGKENDAAAALAELPPQFESADTVRPAHCPGRRGGVIEKGACV